MPRLTGNSSQGSKPTTWLSLTLSWMPHCTPQKQQWVLTVLSASAAAPQPPAGVSLRCGPYCAISASSVTGSLATPARLLHHAGLGEAQPPALARRAQIDLQADAGHLQDFLQVRQV